MSIHEQARAEAEKRLPDRPETLARDMAHNVQAARLRQSFVAGAEWAATRTRVVTTVTELDALPAGSIVLTTDDAVWQHFRVSSGWSAWRSPVWSGAYTSTDLADYGGGLLPATVLYDPEETR